MKVPNFSNVMGQYASEIQDFDEQINVLETQRGSVIQQRFNSVLHEFHALNPGIEFGKTVVTYPTVRSGYSQTPIVRTGILGELKLTKSWSGIDWTMPLCHLTKLNTWDRKHPDYKEYPKYNRRILRADKNSFVSVGDDFEIVGEIVRQSHYGLFEVKFL